MLIEIGNWQLKHCKIQICLVKVRQNLSVTWSHCFHFPNSNISVIPYTHVPTGKTFSLTASKVLFPDPLETTASKPHNEISTDLCESLGPFCSSSGKHDSYNCCAFLVQHSVRVSRLLECLNG